ncbi:serine/threonine protein kinase [Aeoliella mucimassa]|uniref:Serine/threonine-protein kinase PknL n=1 Tax=Aeoliella mucimassa TaxID=2527972 RepID=A0A518AW22_9BACT|nr:serine/threonine-protein kinase [Aeoliella mucimassa]QDU58908.1 Serine/threonine-protein kinase PknL [Aeoliella mucimassa]
MSPRRITFLPTKATFKLGERLGMGTVGVVYQATSPDIDEPVALKLLHPNVSGDENIVNRFEREIMIMERLNHPHIVKHYGGGIMDGQHFYAMQLLDHGSLKDRLQEQGPLPWPQVAVYTIQIASALQHAHNHGIVHRDLKPSNLFFDEKGNLVLGDFGIARDTHSAEFTDHGMTVGTYAYMAPEQITADSHLGPKADLYSLGCVMYEMLTGSPPFKGANFAQVWEQHLNRDPEPLAKHGVDCPEWLESLVRQLLEKVPHDRPFSARTVQGYLHQHLVEEFGEEEAKELLTNLPSISNTAPIREQPRTWVLWLALAAIVAVCTIAVLRGS